MRRPATEKDHRGTLKVRFLYRMKVAGATDGAAERSRQERRPQAREVTTPRLPRKADWLGW